jgi:hypothetical protein
MRFSELDIFFKIYKNYPEGDYLNQVNNITDRLRFRQIVYFSGQIKSFVFAFIQPKKANGIIKENVAFLFKG